MSRKRDPRKDRARKRRIRRRTRDRISRLKWEATQPTSPDECPFGPPHHQQGVDFVICPECTSEILVTEWTVEEGWHWFTCDWEECSEDFLAEVVRLPILS